MKFSIFHKAILFVTFIVFSYTMTVIFFIIPNVNENMRKLETKNAFEIQNKVITISKNFYGDIKDFSKIYYEKHQEKLKNVTDTLLSSLHYLYEKNKDNPEIENLLLDYIKNTHYGDNGYFWVNDFSPKMIMHPFTPELDGENLSQFKEQLTASYGLSCLLASTIDDHKTLYKETDILLYKAKAEGRDRITMNS